MAKAKLVRDEVPSILIRQGLNPSYRALSFHDHNRYDHLRDKLLEVSGEAALAVKTGNPEHVLVSLGSLLEVMGVVAAQYRLNLNDVRDERDRKRKVKGGYTKFYILDEENRRL